jgi:PAS domain S-box-containing protein
MMRPLSKRLRPSVPEEFRAETRRLVLEGGRTGILLGVIFLPIFVGLDYLRLADRFLIALGVRASGWVVLVGLLLASSTGWARRRAEWFAASGVAVISAILLVIARLSQGPADPTYLTQAMTLLLLITGAALLLPVDGATMLALALIPSALQVLVTLDYPPVENLPILILTAVAVAIATISTRNAYATRFSDYQGRRAAEALRQNAEVLQAVVDKAPIGLWASNREGTITLAAGTVLAGLGATAEAMIGRSVSEVYRNPPGALDNYRRAAAGEEVNAVREIHGSVFDSRLCPAREANGELRGVIGVVTDITERTRLEAQLRQSHKMEAVGGLAAGLAHEISNPLTYVVCNLDRLRSELAAAAQTGAELAVDDLARCAREAGEGIDRVRRIVGDLRTFTHFDAEERRGAVDVNAVMERAVQMTANEVRFRARLVQEAGRVSLVRADERRLLQVFVNLLINAAHSIEEGHAETNQIRVRSGDEDGDVWVEVSDSGRGVSSADLEKIFDPFFMTRAAGKGTGLGLSISRNIVASYGGRIEASSSEGEGNRFVVRLPAAESGAFAAPPLTAAADRFQSAPRGRVLIVDDEPRVRSTAAMLLKKEHDVCEVGGGREALAVVDRDTRFDVILCDLMMPDMSGMELHASLSERWPQLANRMVFMTGGAFTPRANDFLRCVPNRRVDKPFDAKRLLGLVRDLVTQAAAAA